MNEYKLFVQRTVVVGITNLFIGLSGIILLPILTKNLPVDEYGIWIQISVTVSLIPLIVTLGLPYTMVRFLPGLKKREEVQEGFYSISFIVLFTSASTSLLLFLLSRPIAARLFDDNATIIKILSGVIFMECLNLLLLNFFRTFQQIKRYSIFSFIRASLKIVLVAFFILSGYRILGAVIGLLISSFFVFLIMASFIISEVGIKIPKFKNIKEYLSFGLPTIPGNLSSWIVNSSDRYIIGIFLGTAFVGYYSSGYILGNVINMFIGPLAFMLPAVLSKYYDENNMKEVKTILRYSLKYFLLLAIPSAFGLSLLSKPLLTIISTPEIASQGYLITPFVTVSAVLFGVYVVIAQGLYLAKRTDIGGKLWTIAAMLNLGLNFVFVPRMGIVGAAITTLIAFTLVFIFAIYYSFRYLTFDVDFSSIGKSFLASILMILVIIKWNSAEVLNILIEIGICGITYSVVLLLLRGFKREEIAFLKGLFKT